MQVTAVEKVVVTVVLAVNTVVHVPVPAAPPPLHPVNAEPGVRDGAATTFRLWLTTPSTCSRS